MRTMVKAKCKPASQKVTHIGSVHRSTDVQWSSGARSHAQGHGRHHHIQALAGAAHAGARPAVHDLVHREAVEVGPREPVRALKGFGPGKNQVDSEYTSTTPTAMMASARVRRVSGGGCGGASAA